MRQCGTCKKKLHKEAHPKRKYCSRKCSSKAYYNRLTPEEKEKRKEYQRERHRIRVLEDGESIARQRRRTRKNSQAVRRIVAGYKTRTGCVDCGYNAHACALDFDHVSDDKFKAISRIRSLVRIHDEMQKCEVVCANCHRVRTLNRQRMQNAETKNGDG